MSSRKNEYYCNINGLFNFFVLHKKDGFCISHHFKCEFKWLILYSTFPNMYLFIFLNPVLVVSRCPLRSSKASTKRCNLFTLCKHSLQLSIVKWFSCLSDTVILSDQVRLKVYSIQSLNGIFTG